MRKYFKNLEVKENDVLDGTIREKLVVPTGFNKKLNDIEIGKLLQAQLLEDGLALDSVTILGGSRIVSASENYKSENKEKFKLIDSNTSNRLREYLDKFEKEFGRIVYLSELNGLSFEQGEQLLLDCGYEQVESVESDSTIADYLLDIYYSNDNEDADGEEIDRKSFAKHCNRNDDPLNDEGTRDFIVKQGWEQV